MGGGWSHQQFFVSGRERDKERHKLERKLLLLSFIAHGWDYIGSTWGVTNQEDAMRHVG